MPSPKKETKIDDYVETEEEAKKGHEGVRNKNFECDPDIDVPG